MTLNSIERLHVGNVIWFPVFKKKDNGQCTWKRGQILESHLFPDHVLVTCFHRKKKSNTTAFICPASAIYTDAQSPTFCILKNSYEDFLDQIVCRHGYSKISLPLEVFEQNESMCHFLLSDQGSLHDWRVLLVYATLLFHSLIKKKSWLLCQKISSNLFFNFNTLSYCCFLKRVSSLYAYSSSLDQFGSGFRKMFQCFSKALCHYKSIVLILLGHSVSCTSYVALQLIKKFTMPHITSVLSQPFCMAYILTVFTQCQREERSGYQSLAGFHYRLFFHPHASPPIHCCISLFCGPLLLGLRKTSNSYSCPLIFYILCTVILKDQQHPESCVISPTLQDDAKWILQNLYSAQIENIECLSFYKNVNEAFVYCHFSFSFIHQVWKLIFLIAFLETGFMFFSTSRHQNVSTGSFLTWENFLQRMLFYLDIPLVENKLENMLISDLHCLCRLSNTLYYCMLKFLISAFNSKVPPKTKHPNIWHVDIVYGVGETLDKMELSKPAANDMSKICQEFFPFEANSEHGLSLAGHTLDEFFVRCCQDVLNSSYVYDTVLEDMSIHKKHMKRVIRKDVNLFSNEIVVWKCLKLCHEYLHLKENNVQHAENKNHHLSSSERNKLINKTNKRSSRLFLNELKESSQNSTCISFNTQKPAWFEFSHYLSQACYNTHEFYFHNTMYELPKFLRQLLQQSSSALLKRCLTTYCPPSMTHLRSVQCEETLKNIYRTIHTVHNRFYLLNFFHGPLQMSFQNYVPGTNGPLRSADVQQVAYQLYYYRFAQSVRSQDYHFINTEKLLKKLECFTWMLKENQHWNSFSETKKIHSLLQVLGVSFFPYTWCRTIVCLHHSTLDFINARVKHFYTSLLPACIRLQRCFMSFLYRRRKQIECRAITHLQACIRSIQIKKELQKTIENTTESLMWGLVVFLCRTCHVHNTSYVEANEFTSKQILLEQNFCQRKLQATVRIQAWWRGLLAMKSFKQKEKEAYCTVAALVIQSVCRRYLAQLHLCIHLEEKKLNDAAIIIQKNLKCWWHRKRYLQLIQLRVAIVPIKRIISSIFVTKQRLQMLHYLRHHRSQRTNLLKNTLHLNFSAICIQRFWKGYIIRKQYHFLLRLAQFCQTIAFTNLYKVIYHRILYKIIFLQKWWKSYLQLRPFRPLFLSNTRLKNVSFLKTTITGLSSVKDTKSIAYRQEIISFHLLHIPLFILQAVYCHSFYSFINDSIIIPLQFTSKQINPNPWAWPFLRLVEYCAQTSWNTLVEKEPEAFHLSWYQLEVNYSSHPFLKANKSLSSASWPTISLLTQMPQLVWIQSISIGGQHTLLILGSLQKKSFDSSKKTKSSNFYKHQKYKSYSIIYSVYAWGSNERGQLGRYETIEAKKKNIYVKDVFEPLQFSFTTRKQSSFVASQQTCSTKPYCMNHSTSIQFIGTGNEFSIALAFDGSIYTWGDNTYGQTGQGFRYHYIDKPTILKCFEESRILSFSNSPYHVMCLTHEGLPYTWGKRTHIGLDDLFVEGDIYTPCPIVWKDSKIIPCDRTLSGYGFNILCPMHSTSLLYVWGRNDSGQLGLGPEAPFLSHTIQEIQCEIPFSVPTHYASLKKISCGSNFVVATVHSSAFPLFLWGAFKIFDPVQTSFETNPSRIFLSLNKKKPTSNKTSLYPIDQSFKIMSIMKPTPVLSEFWENSCIDDVTCGHSSSVQVAFFSNNSVYGFNFLQPHWYHKAASEQKQQTSFYSYHTPTTENIDTKHSIYPSKLEGEFHLIPALYQFAKWRNGIHPLRTLHTTYNSRGFQLDYAVCSKTNLNEIFRHFKLPLQSNTKVVALEPSSNISKTQVSKETFSKRIQTYFTPQKATDQKFINESNTKKPVFETSQKDHNGTDAPFDIQKNFPFHLCTSQQKQAILLGEKFLGPFNQR